MFKIKALLAPVGISTLMFFEVGCMQPTHLHLERVKVERTCGVPVSILLPFNSKSAEDKTVFTKAVREGLQELREDLVAEYALNSGDIRAWSRDIALNLSELDLDIVELDEGRAYEICLSCPAGSDDEFIAYIQGRLHTLIRQSMQTLATKHGEERRQLIGIYIDDKYDEHAAADKIERLLRGLKEQNSNLGKRIEHYSMTPHGIAIYVRTSDSEDVLKIKSLVNQALNPGPNEAENVVQTPPLGGSK